MPPTLPPLAALFLTHFHELKGQEVVYYASLSDDLQAGLIEHTSLPSGMHLRDTDLVVFSHHGLPGAGLFRSRVLEGEGAGRGRRMGTLGVVLAPPGSPDDVFDLATPLEDLYDKLEGVDNPFSTDDPDGPAVKALLDSVWESLCAKTSDAPALQTATTVALRLSRGMSPAHPATYFSALLAMLGPTIITVYKASLSGQRILLYAPPPLLPLAAFAWCIWAMGLPPSSAATGGARSSTWLGQIGLMDMDSVKKRHSGWVATTSDLMYKSHTDAYDVLIDFSASLPKDDSDVRSPTTPPVAPTVLVTTPNDKDTRAKPTTTSATYAFKDLALYRSLVLLDQSPRGVHAETVGFSATSRAGGMWLIVFEMLERIWNLCVGVCEFALGRGQVGHIALDDDDIDQDSARHLLGADLVGDEDDEEDDDDDDEPLSGDRVPDDLARRGRLILDQFHHNAYHLYARLVSQAAGNWELTDADVRQLTGASRLSPWGGRESTEGRYWLALARAWNVEPSVADEGSEGEDS